MLASFADLGCVFSYPVFDGWPVQVIEKKDKDTCVLWLGWPEDLELEMPPRVTIRRGEQQRSGQQYVLLSQRPVNPYGVTVDEIFFPQQHTAGYTPNGHWDALRFAHGAAVVTIELPVASAQGFSRERFANEVFKTFRFT